MGAPAGVLMRASDPSSSECLPDPGPEWTEPSSSGDSFLSVLKVAGPPRTFHLAPEAIYYELTSQSWQLRSGEVSQERYEVAPAPAGSSSSS